MLLSLETDINEIQHDDFCGPVTGGFQKWAGGVISLAFWTFQRQKKIIILQANRSACIYTIKNFYGQ